MNQPNTLKELRDIAIGPLWDGKKYRQTAVHNIDEFIEIVGDIPLSTISITTIDTWWSAISPKLTGSTINRKLTNIHSLLNYAVEREWMGKVPKLPWHKESPGRVRWVTEEEEKRIFELLAAWGEDEVADFIAVLIATGMRRGELLNLKRAEVEKQWARLWETKQKNPRSVPLTEEVHQTLIRRLPWKLDESKLRRVWEKLRKEMGLQDDKNFVLHVLRHTMATRMLKTTNNIAMVQKMLGHRQIKGALRYAHLNDQDLLNAVVATNTGSAATQPPQTIIQIDMGGDVQADEVVTLFKAVGSPFAEKPGELMAALKNSHSLVTARANGKLIGLGNAISDGHLFVYYPHALIHPDYQGKGFGKSMMEQLRKRYSGFQQQGSVADLD